MLNRGLTCVTRPSAFDFWSERQVNPVSGYGIIPILMAAASIGGGLLDGKAKKKQAKKDAKVAKAEEARQQEMMRQAAQKKQMTMVFAVAGVAVVGALAFGFMGRKK